MSGLRGQWTMRLLTVVALTVGWFVAPGTAKTAQALCLSMTPEEQVNLADAIAVGTVFLVLPDMLWGDGPRAVVSMESYLKGSGPKTITVRDYASSVGFMTNDVGAIGKRYVFFLEDEGGGYASNRCAGTQPLTSPEARGFLDRVTAITGPGVPPNSLSAWPPGALPVVALGVLAFSWFAAWAKGRRRSET